jgi:hypothetical protein
MRQMTTSLTSEKTSSSTMTKPSSIINCGVFAIFKIQLLKIKHLAGCQCFTPVIIATQEGEIRRVEAILGK